MAGGWTRDGAVQDQIDATVKDAVLAARARLAAGEGEGENHCVECGEPIPERRRRVMPRARTCIECQSSRDGRTAATGINRRGSKDSQLK